MYIFKTTSLPHLHRSTSTVFFYFVINFWIITVQKKFSEFKWNKFLKELIALSLSILFVFKLALNSNERKVSLLYSKVKFCLNFHLTKKFFWSFQNHLLENFSNSVRVSIKIFWIFFIKKTIFKLPGNSSSRWFPNLMF